MKRLRPPATFLVMAALAASPWAATTARGADDKDRAATELFLGKVAPLLKTRCLACHGDDAQKLKGGLDLRSREAMLKGGESGEPALEPGRPDDSLLYLAVTRDDPTLAMPPKENDKLAAEEVAAIRSWIEAGAPWAAPAEQSRARTYTWDNQDGVRVATSGGLSSEWTNRRYKPADLWAYRPLHAPAVPVAPGVSGVNPIDAFLDQARARLGLQSAPPADRRTLIRRATFDLTGLPPSPGEIQAFLDDPDPDEPAFDRVIDRLLASPHYGEQMGRHWLDVTRYADSSGFANDFERGGAWRYRDYVIRSFNEDRPYDRFIREQIAGDELDPDNPEALVAVGFLRMGPWELTGMEVARIARQKFLDDVTDSVGQVFLAHPLQCARCHDHKFDPVPTRDYYGFQAVFATTQLAERAAPFLPEENTSGFEEKRYLEARRADYQAMLEAIRAKEEAAAQKWCAERKLPYIPRLKGLRDGVTESQLPPRSIGLEVRDFGMQRIANKGLERLRWELERYEPFALSVYSGRTPELRAVTSPRRMPADRMTQGELETTAILAGGDPFSPKEPVPPCVLSAVPVPDDNAGSAAQALPSAIPTTIAGRRTALADWIATADNPLTPRVMVNRIWLWHFGRAIAGNPNNFGATGKKPVAPELLDWLASEFLARGWSIKAMHRLIMTSAAYRRSSLHPTPAAVAEKDPEGSTVAVFRPRRLEAEELRDALLAVTGELNPALGGIPVRPELNPEVALQPRMVMGTFAAGWEPSTRPERRHRRSIYTLRLRGLRDPFSEVFNQPSPETSCEAREASTVTPQVFSLLNSVSMRNRALALAARLMRESRDRADAIDRAFRQALGRPATPGEATACLKHWDAMTARHQSIEPPRMKPLHEVVREAVEENSGVPFSYTEVLESAADFVPDPQPADVDAETRGLMEICLVLFNTNEFISID
jgi:mono/diheme cytochrome c family protein